MPHKPGHGTQRRRIERQARGQSPTKISKSSVNAAKSALSSAEANRLNNLVSQGQSDNVYRNEPNVFVPQEVVSESNPLNIPQKALDFVAKNTDEFGRMNEAAKARINMYTDGIGDYKYVDDQGEIRRASAVFDKLTPYQRDLNAFIQSSPESAAAYKSRFPITNALMTGLPTLLTSAIPGFNLAKNIFQSAMGSTRDAGSDVVNSLKQIAMNKGIIPKDNLNSMGTTASDSSSTDTSGIIQNIDPNALQAPELSKFLSPQDMGFSSPLGRFVPNPQDMGIAAQPGRFVQNPQDMNIQPKMSSQDYFNDLSPAELNFLMGGRNPAGMFGTDYVIPMNEGGLASINNPEYNMLMNASNFDL